MKEENLVILRSFIDLSILMMSTYQVKVIVDGWRDAMKKLKEDKKILEAESLWRHRLLNILSHDIKEPMVYTLQLLRKLRKETTEEIELKTINRIENAQMLIREVISNVETFSSRDFEVDLPNSWISLDEVLMRTMPWLRSRLEDKALSLNIRGNTKDVLLNVNPEAFAYQIFTNLMTNAIKFSPLGSEIVIHVLKAETGTTTWIIKDSGPGIRSEAIGENIFSELGTSGEPGSGLGIRIAKTFAHKQGIRLRWLSKNIDPAFDEDGTSTIIEQDKFRGLTS
jgi:K+-sensing histidine kinase KdpD